MTPRHVQLAVSSKLSEDDWKLVDAFKARADRLAGTRLASDASISAISGTIKISHKGLTFQGNLPPESELVEHLAALRLFVLKREPSNFERMLSTLGRYADTDDARAALRQIRGRWNDALFNGAVSLAWNGKKLTTALVLDLWFNGFYFHGDEKKAEELASLAAVVTEVLAKFALVDAAYNATKIILKLRASMEGLARPANS